MQPFAPAPLLLPTEALLAGFEFGADEPPNDLAAAAGAPVPAPGETLPASAAGPRHTLVVGDLRLLIRIADSSALVDVPPLSRLPQSPPWMCGITNVNGALMPVFDLARLCGLTASREPVKSMLLVLGHGADVAGVLVDELPARIRVDLGTRQPGVQAPRALREAVTDCHLSGDQLWFDVRSDVLRNLLERSLEAA